MVVDHGDNALESARVFGFRYDRWCGWLLGLLGIGRRWSRVTVAGDHVVITMGWAFRVRVPVDRIVDASRAERPFIGWGVHGWGGRWLVNGSLRGLVTVEIDPPVRARVVMIPLRLRTVWVSLADPDAFLTALAEIRG
jgi:hypothetical protein